MNRRAFILILLFSVFVFRSESQSHRGGSPYAKGIAAIEEFASKRLKEDRGVGVSLGFMKDGFVWAKGFGFADLENSVDATEKSSYRLASVTKPITAVAILQLAEEGKINLDAEVQTYISYFPRKRWPVTIRQLLGHLGGISHYKDPEKELHIKDPKSTREAIAIFQDFDLIAEPGTRYSYSSYGYNLLGAVIEEASGTPYGEYMRKRIWEPVGMSDTRMDDPREIIPNRVRGYGLVDGKIRNSEFVDISSRFAAGGTRSTVLDLLRFCKGLSDGKLLADSTRRLMGDSMVRKDGQLTGYGMGWQTSAVFGRPVLYHSGGQQETRTALYYYPTKNFFVAVGCNFESANPFSYADAVVRAILEEPVSVPVYAPKRVDEIVLRALNSAAMFDREEMQKYGNPAAANGEEIDEAFRYFNAVVSVSELQKSFDSTAAKIRLGRHPAVGRAFTKVGAAIAGKLTVKFGREKMEEYFKTGFVGFFADYVELSRNDVTIQQTRRLRPELEQILSQWGSDWRKTWTLEVRSLRITPETDFEALGKKLRPLFRGASIYPSFTNEFGQSVRQLAMQGKKEAALRAGALGVELYPASDFTTGVYGVALLFFGDNKAATPHLRKSVGINPNGFAGAGSLNSLAYSLAGDGNVDAGMNVLLAAVDLHPKEANLYDSIGEFHLRKGDKEAAITWYRKALEVDPNFESSKKMLDRITGPGVPR